MAEHKARLPCNIDPSTKNEEIAMVLWYREETSRRPIFSVDARSSNIGRTKTWSDERAFGHRAAISPTEPADLEIDPLESGDDGIYRCRVDFKDSPTKNYKINLTVIGKAYLSVGNLFFSFVFFEHSKYIHRMKSHIWVHRKFAN